MNVDIANHIKQCSTCLDFKQTQMKEKVIHHEIPGKPWKVIGVDMLILASLIITASLLLSKRQKTYQNPALH